MGLTFYQGWKLSLRWEVDQASKWCILFSEETGSLPSWRMKMRWEASSLILNGWLQAGMKAWLRSKVLIGSSQMWSSFLKIDEVSTKTKVKLSNLLEAGFSMILTDHLLWMTGKKYFTVMNWSINLIYLDLSSNKSLLEEQVLSKLSKFTQ